MVICLVSVLFCLQLCGETFLPKQETSEGALFAALESGSFESIKELVVAGVDVNAFEPEEEFLLKRDSFCKYNGECYPACRQTVLDKAVATCSEQVVKLLLEAGANPNKSQSKPLVHAAEELEIGKVALLLEYKVDSNQENSLGTALYRAVYNRHPRLGFARTDDHNGDRSRTVQLLLEHGADPKRTWSEYSSALEYACEFGTSEIIRLLLEYCKLDDQHDRELLQKAFVRAYRANYQEALKLLLDKGIALEESGVPLLPLLIKLNYSDKAHELLNANTSLDHINQVDQEGYTALMLAVRGGHADLVRQLLAKGANPNAKLASNYRDNLGMQPLDFALEEAPRDSRLVITELLLAYGADPNQLTQCGYTALHRAVKEGNTVLVKLLLKYKAHSGIYSTNYDPLTPFQQAVLRSSLDMVKLLAENGADITLLTRDNKWSVAELAASKGRLSILKYLLSRKLKLTSAQISNCFLLACKGGFIGTVKFLLEKWPTECLSYKDSFGLTPLHAAVETGEYRSCDARQDDIKIVRLLLEKGVSVNAQDTKGNTPLYHLFIARGSKDYDEQDAILVKLLLEKGANSNLANNDGDTPLHAAVEEYYYWAPKKIELIQILLENGASLMHKNSNGETALFVAMGSDSQTAQFMLDTYLREHKELDVHQKNTKGKTLLHQRVAANEHTHSFAIAQFLLSKGALVNARDFEGRTPLHDAVAANRTEAVSQLVAHGAEVNARDNQGKTPLHLANKYYMLDILNELIKVGADVNARDNEGNTLLTDDISADAQILLMKHGAKK